MKIQFSILCFIIKHIQIGQWIIVAVLLASKRAKCEGMTE